MLLVDKPCTMSLRHTVQSGIEADLPIPSGRKGSVPRKLSGRSDAPPIGLSSALTGLVVAYEQIRNPHHPWRDHGHPHGETAPVVALVVFAVVHLVFTFLLLLCSVCEIGRSRAARTPGYIRCALSIYSVDLSAGKMSIYRDRSDPVMADHAVASFTGPSKREVSDNDLCADGQ
jgi:hypothetical protein